MKKTILISLLTFSMTTVLANYSVYTSIDVNNCITIASSENDPEPEIDYYIGHCKGLNNFKVIISGSDIRYGLSLEYAGVKVRPLYRINSFHDMGSSKIEWRFGKGQKKPKALIFRIKASHPNALKPMNHLHITKLDGENSCTVAELINERDMNRKARRIADSIENYNCLF